MADQEAKTRSKLVGRLREVSRGVVTPIGFGRAQAAKVPAMLLLALLGRNDAALAEAAASAGADALLTQIRSESAGSRFGTLAEERPGLEAVLQAANGRPVGVAVGAAGALDGEEIDEVSRLGLDSASVLPELAPAEILSSEAVGRIVRLGEVSPVSPLRGINDLKVDAVELALERPKDGLSGLSIYDLAALRQSVEFVRRPVLVRATWKLKPADLKLLRDLGVEALILTPEQLGRSADEVRTAVGEYRQAIDKLGAPIGRGRGFEPRRVTLPTVKPEPEEEEGEEE